MKFYDLFMPIRLLMLHKQILRIMRLTIIIITCCLMQVSAAGYGQNITLKRTNTTLEKVFEEIRKQSGYDFFYDADLSLGNKKVSLELKNADIDQALDKALAGQPYEYAIENKTVIIKKKTPSFLDRVIDRIMAIDVRGRIVDKDGAGLPGATISIKGKNQSVTSGTDGQFLLTNVDENATLVVSYIGYKTVEISAVANLGNIRLEEVAGELEEVTINKGYYTEEKRLSTGSVGKVSSEIINRQPVANPLMALQGRVPGIYIQQNTGMPGGNFQVRIRGTNSIQNGNNPFYIVDGVPYISETLSPVSNSLYGGGQGTSPLNNINPTDIEAIEILKDADATAIYGSRGANGVVLITTKRGRAGETTVDINLRNGVSKALPRIELLNTRQYILMREEALLNDGFFKPQAVEEYDINGVWDKNRYTDWQDELIGGTANANLLNASISGGNAHTQYSLGAGFNRETTVFKSEGSTKRYSTHFNIVHSSKNNKFNMMLNSTLSSNNIDFPYTDLTSVALSLAPNAPALYNQDGDINWENSTFTNPLANLNRKFDGKSFSLINSLEFGYQILGDLRLTTRFGMTDLRNKELIARPHTIYAPALGYTPAVSELNLGDASVKSWQAEPQINYDKQIGNHKLSILLGSAFQQSISEKSDELYKNFPSNNLIWNPKSAIQYQLTSYDYTVYKYAAVFGRVGYNYKDRYVLNLTGRRDGSSRFGLGKQFANLGAIGAAWIFTNETFSDQFNKILSFGKLRTSYGITGNDQIGDYQYLDTYTGQDQYQGTSLLSPTQLYNPDYGWETNKKFETALDLGFFNDRITSTLAYFQNRSSNQLVNYRLAGTTGFPSIIDNLPAVVENTGIEIEINSTNIQKHNWSWKTSFNITSLRNKLVAFPNIESSSYYRTYEVGKSLNMRKVFYFERIDPATGLAQFADMNGDGSLTIEDQLYPIELKQNFFGGLNNSFSIKGIQADIFFQFVKQTRDRYRASSLPGRNGVNQSVEVLESRWRKPGDNSENLRLSNNNLAASQSYQNLTASNWSLVDASFIRLKNVSLSYQFPSTLLKRTNARVYLQGQNLLTITKYNGLDPETGNTSLPALTTIVTGVQLTF